MASESKITIIEILIIASIIGLIATIAISSLNGVRKKGRDAKRVSDITQIQKALDFYYSDKVKYPISTQKIVLGQNQTMVICDGGIVAENNDKNCPEGKIYMSRMPSNPTPGGLLYTYSTDDKGTSYSISFKLEEAIANLSAGNHFATNAGIK